MNKVYFILHILAISISYLVFFVASLAALLYLVEDRSLKIKRAKTIFSWMPDLSVLDKLNYKFIGLGFVMLTLAIIIGSIWNKNISGVYWNWKTKWIYSVIIWLLYAIILHVRLSSKLRGRKIAVLSIAGFFIIILSLFSSCS